MERKRQLKLGAIIDGVGWNYMGWRHADMPADASENIDFYIQKAKEPKKLNLICFF
ncbi:hypothetical protein [Sinobaca sp. H24]|uniref:hypothetical protein n=1 Tax=Sinobaca sp. H24 TaxID=2923376 RepID=UPI0027E2864C|nr:hypothetical protein [Sinobaca sp. H24]